MRLLGIAVTHPRVIETAAVAVVTAVHRGRRRPDVGLLSQDGVEIDQQVRVVRQGVAAQFHLTGNGGDHVLGEEALVVGAFRAGVLEEIEGRVLAEIRGRVVIGADIVGRAAAGGHCEDHKACSHYNSGNIVDEHQASPLIPGLNVAGFSACHYILEASGAKQSEGGDNRP